MYGTVIIIMIYDVYIVLVI